MLTQTDENNGKRSEQYVADLHVLNKFSNILKI